MIGKVIVVIITAGFVWSFFVEPYKIQKNTIRIGLEGISSEIEKKTIVHISDIHFRHFGRKEKLLVQLLKEINPDYLLITGDLIDRKSRNTKEFQDFCKRLAEVPRQETFLVFGNHEHRNQSFQDFKKIIQESLSLIHI